MSNAKAPGLTRRELLAGTSRVALLTVIPMAAVPSLAAGEAGRPWSDDTFFSDGSGWVDGGSVAAIRSS